MILLDEFRKKISKINSLFLCLTLLISCKLIAAQANSATSFQQFLTRVETLQATNPSDAKVLLESWQHDISQYALEEQINYLKIKSELFVEHGQFDVGLTSASEGLTLAKELNSPIVLMVDLFYSRGFSYESLGDYKSAVQEYLNGLELAESLNEQKHVAYGLANLGAIYYLTERFERSLIVLNDALAIANKSDDDELKGFISSELGILYSYIGQDDKSLAFYQQSYKHYSNAGLNLYSLNSLMNIAANHSTNKRYEQAITVYKDVIEIADDVANNQILYSVYSGLAWAYLKQEDSDPETAHQYMNIAGQYVDSAQQHQIPLLYAIDNAYILESVKRYDEALASLDKAEEIIAKETHYRSAIPSSNILKLRADIFFALKEYEKAYQIQTKYLSLYSQVRESGNTEAIEGLRLKYESQHADLENQILAQEKSVKELELKEAKRSVKNQQLYTAVISVVALIFAYFLLKVIRGQKKLLHVTRTDGLTGIANRRYLIRLGESYFSQAQLAQESFSLFVLDVDDFKSINDNFGHKTGDKVLKKIAQIGHDCMRKTDTFGRFGGEEFVALFPNTDAKQAKYIAQRVKEQIADYHWQKYGIGQVTVSIGLSEYNKHQHEQFDALIKQADVLLYQAKNDGKNMVCV